jgi:hypothetical protein
LKTLRRFTFYLLPLLCTLGLAGCGKKAVERNVDENKPLSEVRAEAEKMSVDELRDMAVKYKEAMASKMAEVDKLTVKLTSVLIGENRGSERKEFTAEMESLNKSLSALGERFQVYYDKLKEKGGDLSGLEAEGP